MKVRPDHQEIVRDVNDSIRAILEGFRAPHGEFLCECDRVGCEERVALALGDYDGLRNGEDGGRLLAPKHDDEAGLGVFNALDPRPQSA